MLPRSDTRGKPYYDNRYLYRPDPKTVQEVTIRDHDDDQLVRATVNVLAENATYRKRR